MPHSKVIWERDGRIARIWLNRPEVMNAIDDELPVDLARCVGEANDDDGVNVLVLAGKGEAFCAGYDLTFYAQGSGSHQATQDMPWDPMRDYKFMKRNTDLFMSLWRSYKPDDRQGARFRGRRRQRHRAVLRPCRHGRECPDRIHAGACLGLPDDGDVGLPARTGKGQAHAVHRRQNHGRRGEGARPGYRCGGGGRTRRRASRSWHSAWRACRATS